MQTCQEMTDKSTNTHGACCITLEHVEKLQKIVYAKIPRNGKMCKNKWNGLNSCYKKLSNYHKGTSHHLLFWETILKECDRYHLSRQFNEFYKVTEAFQGEYIINFLIHVKDLQAEGDGNFVVSMSELNTLKERDSA
jgi:hypothetical protein